MKLKSVRGFSLIELLIAFAILAILATVAVPNFTKYRQNSNLKEATRGIVSDIQLYKQAAINENVRYRINFITATNSYTITKETVLNSDIFNINIATKKVGLQYDDIEIDGTPSFSGSVTHVVFSTRGTCGAGSVKLRHNKTLSKATITTNVTGRVRVGYELK